MSIANYLRENDAVEMPPWLANFEPHRGRFPLTQFLRSRVVYYPGALYDGQAVKVFGSASAAHCFVYVDFSYKAEGLRARLDAPGDNRGYEGDFRGYHTLRRLNVSAQRLLVDPWLPPNRHLEYPDFAQAAIANPFAFVEILERDEDYGDEHGSKRLAILFIAACGYTTFHALVIQQQFQLFAILIDDAGFAGNPDRFGPGGLLEELAIKHGKLPKYLLAQDHDAWENYHQIEGLAPENGGMYPRARSLFIHR